MSEQTPKCARCGNVQPLAPDGTCWPCAVAYRDELLDEARAQPDLAALRAAARDVVAEYDQGAYGAMRLAMDNLRALLSDATEPVAGGSDEPHERHDISAGGEPGDYYATATVFYGGERPTRYAHGRGPTALAAIRDAYRVAATPPKGDTEPVAGESELEMWRAAGHHFAKRGREMTERERR